MQLSTPEHPVILETERLILRPWKKSDAPELYCYAKDPAVGPIAGWPVHTSVEYSRRIISTVFAEPETYAVVLKETGLAVGCAVILLPGCCNAPAARNEAEIGYWIGVPYWGHELIPEAVRALLRRCFTTLGCDGVWSGRYDGNENSRRVQEKCGFRFHHTEINKPCLLMGELRTEHFSYLSRERWQSMQDAG